MASQKDDDLHRQRMEAAKALLREFSSHSKIKKKGRTDPVPAPARYGNISTGNSTNMTASGSRSIQANAYVDAILAAEKRRRDVGRNIQQSARLHIDPSNCGSRSENTPPQPTICDPASSVTPVTSDRGALGCSFGESNPATATINQTSVAGSETVNHIHEEDLIDLNWSTESKLPTAVRQVQASQANPEPTSHSSFLDSPIETGPELRKLSDDLSQLNILHPTKQGVIVEPSHEICHVGTQRSTQEKFEHNTQKGAERISREVEKRTRRVISQEAVQGLLTYLMQGVGKLPFRDE
ncbi:hypothetical protein SODALDRAFT_362844 [Sodiomyces alkalinus F11]|uniref:Uncharacterized protein n=1 Tax=Sodiomyces alkalinus (strain CBS 110278 / VKM F-3762 / F11) TaxID=1314773 RepID=A0A3N2PN81_SODAK|nr:hypothetical protein SODALDRAFT_362844 [Sodiomyces alkalinus F11]ROT35987.1 hypothetical protein SODALDRAFT_362844 [Sodiomyces alkalinus F11]